uniref:Uncharacterized protein n=1 Tax=Pithovirus LCPAC102 TaxID=2506587 RepID=A0A481Z320_9VIRU|nr:MAG: hypothetical protein LCPAC102_00730 [Pithovirus LCPAC102]
MTEYECSDSCESNKSIDDNYVWTDFYTTMPEMHSYTKALIEESDSNFNNYSIFSINSHLMNWVAANWDDQIELSFPGKIKKNMPNKIYLTIKPLIGGNTLDMTNDMITDLQRIVDKIDISILKSALLYGFDIATPILTNDGYLISSMWIRQMISYVYINPLLNPIIDETGLYVEIGNYPNYTEIYRKLSVNLISKLVEMYEEGFILEPSEKIIENWVLLEHDDKGLLYTPSWVDKRITSTYGTIIDFLFTRLMGCIYIDYYIGNNKVIIHFIASLLQNDNVKFKIHRLYIRVWINDLDSAQKIATLIEYAESNANGLIILKHVSSLDDINIYKEILSSADIFIKNANVLYYETNDIHRPYTLSIRFSYDTKINLDNISIKLMNEFILYRNIKYSSKPKTTIDDININPIIPYINMDHVDIEKIPTLSIPDKRDYSDKYLRLDASKPVYIDISSSNKEIYKPEKDQIPVRIWNSSDETISHKIKPVDRKELNIKPIRPILSEYDLDKNVNNIQLLELNKTLISQP